jgi:hypothetical protein
MTRVPDQKWEVALSLQYRYSSLVSLVLSPPAGSLNDPTREAALTGGSSSDPKYLTKIRNNNIPRTV